MSWHVVVRTKQECPHCEQEIGEERTVWEVNLTYNLGPMLNLVDFHPDNWKDIPPREFLPKLCTTIATLRADEEFYQTMNPENGWGSYEGLMREVLQPLRNALITHPGARLYVD